MAIYYKEHDMSVKGRKIHADEMKKVVECLQGKNRLGVKEESASFVKRFETSDFLVFFGKPPKS